MHESLGQPQSGRIRGLGLAQKTEAPEPTREELVEAGFHRYDGVHEHLRGKLVLRLEGVRDIAYVAATPTPHTNTFALSVVPQQPNARQLSSPNTEDLGAYIQGLQEQLLDLRDTTEAEMYS